MHLQEEVKGEEKGEEEHAQQPLHPALESASAFAYCSPVLRLPLHPALESAPAFEGGVAPAPPLLPPPAPLLLLLRLPLLLLLLLLLLQLLLLLLELPLRGWHGGRWIAAAQCARAPRAVSAYSNGYQHMRP